jgi:adenine-specific DNA-methyltransferase
MQNMKLYSILETVLKSDTSNLKLIDNKGDLMLNKIHGLIDKTDENLIGLLLENQELREKFFSPLTPKGGSTVYVFKSNDFKFFLDENKIDNSYTQYENRIGLTAGGKFLKDSADVVLDFPYKDCILEGGQSTEEGTDTYFEWNTNDNHYQEKKAKRKEIFFNTILAKDEIDRLLEPKAFTNIKKHTVNGTEFPSFGGVPNGRGGFFTRDENGNITDNLIIKGNNLLALHTLKSEFTGKVKLIYIDPPYNTGNDSFAYNDNFSHSTWLTFMRNRLLIARELLREDGIIYVQMDSSRNSVFKYFIR